jgi:hypothetical protein
MQYDKSYKHMEMVGSTEQPTILHVWCLNSYFAQVSPLWFSEFFHPATAATRE